MGGFGLLGMVSGRRIHVSGRDGDAETETKKTLERERARNRISMPSKTEVEIGLAHWELKTVWE